MRAFISYAVAEKEWGGAVKNALEAIGVRCFLAHEDLQVSEEWRDRIIEELRDVDLFVAVLSAKFKASDWCSQEIGFIVSRPEVAIIPLTIDRTLPYGFLAALQGKYVPDHASIGPILSEVLFRKRPRIMIPPQIQKMKDAGSFRSAEAATMPLVPHFRIFSDAEVLSFCEAVTQNYEVWDASDCRQKYIPEFLAQNGHRIPKEFKTLMKEHDPKLVITE